MKAIRVFTAAALVVCAGCTTFDPQAAHVSKFGPQAVMQQPVDEPDVISLITSGGAAYKVVRRTAAFAEHEPPEKFSQALDQAIAGFYKTGTADEQKLHRNRIQDRLILASNDGCEAYKTVLKRKQSDRNFEFGTAGVLFGAAGAVAQGLTAARNLSALAGATSGIRAEYNREFFADVAAHVITKGINSRRKEILSAISTAQQEKSISQYSLEAALADVVTYHGACSLVGGLEQADGAIAKVSVSEPVGLDALSASIDKVKAAREGVGSLQAHTPGNASTGAANDPGNAQPTK